MLVLLFELGTDRYAIDACQVLEVLPLVDLRPLPHAPNGVAGLFDFRGSPVPVIDLALLTIGRPATPRLSTRVIVVGDKDDATRPIGLIAERATETARRAAADFVSPGIISGGAPHLGPVATDARGLLQLIDVKRVLPAAVRRMLLEPPVEPSWPLPTSNVW